jgi:hypothetical protein
MRDYAHSRNIIPEHYHSHYYSQPGWNCHHLAHIQSRRNRHADRTRTTVLSQCQCATELTLHQLVPLAHIQSRTSHSIVTTRQYKIQSACYRTGTASSGSHPTSLRPPHSIVPHARQCQILPTCGRAESVLHRHVQSRRNRDTKLKQMPAT